MMMRKLKLAALITLFVAAAALTGPGAQAAMPEQANQVTISAQAGFDYYCQIDAWMPVRVTVENNGADIDGLITIQMDDYYGGRHLTSEHIVLGTVARKEVTLYITPMGYASEIGVTLTEGNKELAAVTASMDCLANTDIIYGVLSDNLSAFTILGDLDPVTGRGVVANLELVDIPTDSRGMEALDVLVISDVDSGALSEGQRQAIVEWTETGGSLIVTGGPGWQKTAAGLGKVLPFKPEGTREGVSLEPLGKLAQWQDYPAETAIGTRGVPTEDAQVISDGSGAVLAAWKPVGAGMAVYLGVDPSLEPLKGWDGMIAVYKALLQNNGDQAGWVTGFRDWYSASQAAATLPGLRLPSALLICGFLALYVAAIGPVNYFILVKLKKRELAWLSIPLVVVFFSGCAILLGLVNRGERAILNRVAVVRVYPGAETAQVDGVVGVYAPARATFDLVLGDGFMAHPMPQSYSFNGEDWDVLVDNGETHLPGYRVDVGVVRSFAMEGQVSAPKFSHTLTLTPQGDAMKLAGTVVNDSGLALQDAVILGPGAVFPLGDFGPGESKEINLLLERAEMATDQEHPIYSSANSATSPTGYSYYYGSDTTVTDIVGSISYYDDPLLYRRYSLVAGLLNSTSSGVSGRGGGIYLSGWVDASPLEVRSGSRLKFDPLDTTLYLVTLEPEVQPTGGELVLGPPMFTWKVAETTGYSSVSPYSTYVTSSRFSYLFSLAQPVSYERVKSLVFHFDNDSLRRATDLKIYLWDFTTASYEQMDIANFGDIEIANPEKYVGPGGAIWLQIDAFLIPLEGTLARTDFTLTVEP